MAAIIFQLQNIRVQQPGEFQSRSRRDHVIGCGRYDQNLGLDRRRRAIH